MDGFSWESGGVTQLLVVELIPDACLILFIPTSLPSSFVIAHAVSLLLLGTNHRSQTLFHGRLIHERERER